MPHEKSATGPPKYETPEDRFEHDIEELEAPPWHNNARLMIIVGVILLVAVAGITYLFMTETKQVKPTGPVVMAIDVIEPRPGRLGNTPRTFRWETVSSTKYYAFALSGKGASAVLIQRASNAPSITLTPDEQSRLVKGAAYVWSVQAYSDVGRVLGRCESAFDL